MQTDDSWGAVAWCTLALVNAGFAEQKHRSRSTWFLVSLLLGPVATFLVVVVVGRRDSAAVGWSDLRSRQDWLGVVVSVGFAALLLGGLLGLTTGTWQAWVVAGAGVVIGVGALVLFMRELDRRRRARATQGVPPGRSTDPER